MMGGWMMAGYGILLLLAVGLAVALSAAPYPRRGPRHLEAFGQGVAGSAVHSRRNR
jgi:hypothetical protein